MIASTVFPAIDFSIPTNQGIHPGLSQHPAGAANAAT